MYSVTATLELSPLEAISRLEEINQYLNGIGYEPLRLERFQKFLTWTATANWEYTTEEAQGEFLQFVADLDWEYPDAANISLKPAVLH
jgi:hypothetical protein